MGSFFHRTVILICKHNEEGAYGLVLNKKTENQVGEMIPTGLPDLVKTKHLFLGGPVQTDAMSYLHTDSLILEANVMTNLNLGHSLESLVEIGESYSPSKEVRVFAGYTGWSPGQLEDEISRNSWLIHPASIDLVFHSNSSTLWADILKEKGWQYRLLAEGPDDLSWN